MRLCLWTKILLTRRRSEGCTSCGACSASCTYRQTDRHLCSRLCLMLLPLINWMYECEGAQGSLTHYVHAQPAKGARNGLLAAIKSLSCRLTCKRVLQNCMTCIVFRILNTRPISRCLHLKILICCYCYNQQSATTSFLHMTANNEWQSHAPLCPLMSFVDT